MWSFVETINMNDKILEVGLESFDKIKRQLDVDIPRLDIIVNGEKINNKNQILKNNLTILRYCTQSVFFQPLSYIIKLFPEFYITHNREEVKSSIIIDTKKYYDPGIFSYIGLSSDSITNCTVSTHFSAIRKNDMEYSFMIHMEFIFELGSNTGTLFFQIL